MKPLFVALAALLLGAPSAPAPVPAYFNDPQTIVRVYCAVDGGSSVGTAVKVGKNTFITAAHVVDEGSCFVGGVAITVTSLDNDRDYATFVGPYSEIVMPYTCAGYHPGEVYLARGYAFGGFELAFLPWEATAIVHDRLRIMLGDAFPGMSGGPVIDHNGRVVGIVNRRLPTSSLPLDITPLCSR